MTRSKRRKKKDNDADEIEVPIFDEEDIDPLDLYDLSDPKEALIVMYKEAYARVKKRKIEDYIS